MQKNWKPQYKDVVDPAGPHHHLHPAALDDSHLGRHIDQMHRQGALFGGVTQALVQLGLADRPLVVSAMPAHEK